MTRYTVMCFQGNYPDNIKIERIKGKDGIYVFCYLLHDGEIHTTLFDGGPFESDEKIDKLIEELLAIDLSE